MKNSKSLFNVIIILCTLGLLFSCEQKDVNPSKKLDEVFIPRGFTQSENLSMDMQSRLDELRLVNPTDHFYYLKYLNGPVASFEEMKFPQTELNIKYVDAGEMDKTNDKPTYQGVIVKKITGDIKDEVFTIIDDQPYPNGGMKKFYEFISNTLKYPSKARNMGIEGKVFVQFVVDPTGKLTEVKAVKGIGAGCDEEAVRVLKEAPKWIPGKVANINVGVRMIMPIVYKLSDNQEVIEAFEPKSGI